MASWEDFKKIGLVFSKSGGFQDLSGITSGLYGLFNNPYDQQMHYLNQIPSTISPYYQPFQDSNKNIQPYMEDYIRRGNQIGGYLTNQYSNLSTPEGAQGLYQALGKGFQSSPGYKYRVDQSLGAANRAAAAGGMLGSPAEQQQVASNVGSMADEDYNNYMSQLLDIYFKGFGGLGNQESIGANVGSNMYGTNANMINNQAQTLAYNLMNQGTNSRDSGSFIGKMINSIGSFL
jgi:hypothetical protein